MSEPNDKKENEKLHFTTKAKYITDPKILAELNKQELYIPPSETKTYDDDLQEHDRLKKSSEKVGYGDPIYVAVCFDDPYKDSETSEERVHLRIINGKHRYSQDKNWPRKYIIVNNIKEFWDYQIYFSIRKKDNPDENKVKFRMIGESLLKEGIPPEKIAAELCRWAEDTHRPQEILACVPDEWKDPTKRANRLNKTKLKNRENIHEKCQQENESLKADKQRLEKSLSEKEKIISERDKHIILQEDRIGKYSGRFQILENVEREVEVEGVGKIKIKLEKNGTTYIVTKATQ